MTMARIGLSVFFALFSTTALAEDFNAESTLLELLANNHQECLQRCYAQVNFNLENCRIGYSDCLVAARRKGKIFGSGWKALRMKWPGLAICRQLFLYKD